MSLDWGTLETPAEAFERLVPSPTTSGGDLLATEVTVINDRQLFIAAVRCPGMSLVTLSYTEWLENNVSTLLLVTGILYLLAAFNTAVVFVSEGYNPQALGAILLLVGLLASLLALVGIYSGARSDTPRLAKATGVVAGAAAVLVVVITTLSVGSRLNLLPETPPPVAMVAIILFILSFLTAGATAIRSGIYPQLVGILLIAEAVALLLVIVVPIFVFQGDVPDTWTFAIEAAQGIVLLWAGSIVRSETGVSGEVSTTETV